MQEYSRVMEDQDDARQSTSARCSCCSLACAVFKILCFSCCRRVCFCCCTQPQPPKPEYSILCVGVNGSGKSTILGVLAGEAAAVGDEGAPEPTMGFSIKAILFRRVILNVKELGGSERIRPYWDKYFSGHHAIIFVVDSCSSGPELEVVRESLGKCLSDTSLQGLPLLLLCNKQDLPAAQTTEEVQEKLKIVELAKGRQYAVRGCSCKDVAGLKQSLELLEDILLQSTS